MITFNIGNLSVSNVEEISRIEFKPDQFLTNLPEDAIERCLDWIAPDYYNVESQCLYAAIHGWIVKTPRHVILVDSCAGNHKNRPTLPDMHQLNTPWLSRLAALGLCPEQIDFVLCTHLHADHVGWNTQLVDGRWVPTFPKARYIFHNKEYDYWNPAHGEARREGMDLVFNDSVLPCMEAGLATLVDDGYSIDDSLQVEAAYGHSAGNVIIRALSEGQTALFTGDCFHSPIQLAFPDVNSRACELPELSRATRRRILSEAAEQQHLLIPAHFPAPYVGRVSVDGDAFRFYPGHR